MNQSSTTESGLPADLSSGVTGSADKVERIREILFGAQMRDYTQRFDTITREVTRLNQDVARLGEQMHEQEARLRKELRQEADRLSAQLQDQDKKQQQQVQQLDQRLTNQLQELDRKHTEGAQKLARNLHQLEQSLRAELHDLSQRLNTMKVDRPTLGDLLIGIGASLKSNNPEPLQLNVDLLDQLNDGLAGDGDLLTQLSEELI